MIEVTEFQISFGADVWALFSDSEQFCSSEQARPPVGISPGSPQVCSEQYLPPVGISPSSAKIVNDSEIQIASAISKAFILFIEFLHLVAIGV